MSEAIEPVTPANQNWMTLQKALENVIDILDAGKNNTNDLIVAISDVVENDGDMLEGMTHNL